jgi:hypothetical protein
VRAGDKQLEATVALFDDTRVLEAAMLAKLSWRAYEFLALLRTAEEEGRECFLLFYNEEVRESYWFATTLVVNRDRRFGEVNLHFVIQRNGQTTLEVNDPRGYHDWMRVLSRHLEGCLRYVDWTRGSFIISVYYLPAPAYAA